MTRAANGRWARYYLIDPPHVDIDPLVVTYHKRVRGQLRQLSVSPKLLRKMLRNPAPMAQSQERAPGGTHDPQQATHPRRTTRR